MRSVTPFTALISCATIAQLVGAQSPTPPVRPIGRLLAMSAESLASVSQVRALPRGRVIVHDNRGRRVLLFDSTLQHSVVIADTTAATGYAYNSRIGGIMSYRGDSTLFIDPVTVSMLVIDPSGRIVRTIAAPSRDASNDLIGGPFGTPGVDTKGRLVFRRSLVNPINPATGTRPPVDSAMIVRFDLTSRSVDSVVKLRVPVGRPLVVTLNINGRPQRVLDFVLDPIPWTDDWAILSDGTIAVVRGREYRVDFFDEDDRKILSATLPFAWQRLSDKDKTTIIDSVRTQLEIVRNGRLRADSVRRADAGRAGPMNAFPPLQFVTLSEMPDYRPAFRQGAALGDADGHLWIRTSETYNDGPVYDVVSRQGALVDRVGVPR